MQDQDVQKHGKTGWKDKAWGGVALLILVLGIAVLWHCISKIQYAEWRNVHDPLSWKVAGVRIDEAEAYWKASAGDARMELRAFCYPVCQLKLAKAEGKGNITVRFLDGKGVQMGDRLYIQYGNGKFIPRQSNSLQVTENEATARLEDGFLTRDDYMLHQFDIKAPLWRAEVECKPEGGEFQPMGILSVLPHDL